jgi:hypothetical protein
VGSSGENLKLLQRTRQIEAGGRFVSLAKMIRGVEDRASLKTGENFGPFGPVGFGF